MKKFTAMILSLLLVLSVSAPAFAATTQQITATYGISLYYNGQLAELTDANGNEVKPFTYMGTTYVPIRGVSNLFGSMVWYDADTKSAFINDDFSEICSVVHKMNNVINSCHILISQEMLSTATSDNDLHTDGFKYCNDSITEITNLLNYLEPRNVNIDIIYDEISSSYQKYIDSFFKTHIAYLDLVNNRTLQDLDTFTSLLKTSDTLYFLALDDIDTFFDDYCTWRE